MTASAFGLPPPLFKIPCRPVSPKEANTLVFKMLHDFMFYYLSVLLYFSSLVLHSSYINLFCSLNTPDMLLSYLLFFLPRIQFFRYLCNTIASFRLLGQHVTWWERFFLNTRHEITTFPLSHLLAILIVWLLKIIVLFYFSLQHFSTFSTLDILLYVSL